MWQQLGINMEAVQESYSLAGSLAIEAFKNMPTVQINNGQALETSRYNALLQRVQAVGKRIARINGFGLGITTFFFMAVRTPVFYYGGYLVVQNELKGGDAIGAFLQIAGRERWA